MKNIRFIIISTIVCLLAASVACKKDEMQIDKDKNTIKKYLKEHNIEAQYKDNVYYVENVVGSGDQCNSGDTVAIKYTVKSLKNPSEVLIERTQIADEIILPYTLATGSSVILGLQVGLPTMKEGGKTTFYIPASYAYGADTLKNNETYANLIYDVELCEVIKRYKRH